jgi:DNA-binding transcriptional LysR family regulator
MEQAMDLSALADFNLVATHGGLGRASRVSGRPKATLSRHVRDLEDALGVRLLERGANRFRLTEDGAALHRRTAGLLSEIDEAGRAVAEGVDRPRGLLRISAPMLFCHTEMGRLAAEFHRACPEVRLEVTAEDRMVDPAAEGYDLVVRTNPRPNDELVGRCFLRGRLLVAAPPDLPRPPLDDPARPELVPAVVLASEPQDAVWRIAGERTRGLIRPDPRLRLWSLPMVRDAARAGAGAALLPETLIADDLAAGRLIAWGEAPERKAELWVLHTSRRLVSRKVSAFVDFLCEAFSAPQGGVMP